MKVRPYLVCCHLVNILVTSGVPRGRLTEERETVSEELHKFLHVIIRLRPPDLIQDRRRHRNAPASLKKYATQAFARLCSGHLLSNERCVRSGRLSILMLYLT